MIDITGGAPELNPHLRRFIENLHHHGQTIQVRTNFTVMLETGFEDMPLFYRDHGVQLVGSMPCYLEENVRAQRGPGIYEKSVEVIRRLNGLGYGKTPERVLNLVYNPGGPFLPPHQSTLEADYRREMDARFGITFTRLLTIANMPLGRFEARLKKENRIDDYMSLLRKSFNPDTIEGLMCRRQVSIGWDGALYDCDFNLAIGWTVNHGAPDHITSFDPDMLARRKIVTGNHCFGCTAGAGSSCGGALT
jgi:radical SAM/Cys-rich protein